MRFTRRSFITTFTAIGLSSFFYKDVFQKSSLLADNQLFKSKPKLKLDNSHSKPRISIIGIGTGGGYAINHLINANIKDVDFICADTDARHLNESLAKSKLLLGANITNGLCAGGYVEIGRRVALNNKDKILNLLQDANRIVLIAGMGGGTGTGATPIIAQFAKQISIPTLAVVTLPFSFEGGKRARTASCGIKEITLHTQTRVIIESDDVLRQQEQLGREISMLNLFKALDETILDLVKLKVKEMITHSKSGFS